MTSPGTEVNVGSIIARVGLDTSGLKKGEADGTSALKRTTQHLEATSKQADKVQRSVDKASGAIKRNADANIESLRRQTQAQKQADRETSTRNSRGGGGARSGAARGAVAGVLLGDLASRYTNSDLGSGSIVGTAAKGAVGGALAGGAIAGGYGALVGGAGGFVAGLATSSLAKDAEYLKTLTAENAAARAEDEKRTAVLRRQLQMTDDLGRSQLRLADAYNKVKSTRSDLTDPGARGEVAGIVSPLISSPFDEHQRGTAGDPGKALDKLLAAQRRVQDAQDRVDKLRTGHGGASKSSLLSAQASVSTAEEAVRRGRGNTQANALRLQAAEARLAELRKGGAVDTKALTTAERHLAEAREKVAVAEKGVKDAGLPVALGPKTLLDRLRVKTADVQSLDRDTRTLVKKGLSAPVIKELLQTEKDAPGTVHQVATSITHAQIVAFNRQQAAMDKAAKDLIKAPLDRAYEDAKRDAERKAKEVAEATRQAFAQFSPNLSPIYPVVPKGAPQPGGNPLTDPLYPTPVPGEPDPAASGRQPDSGRTRKPTTPTAPGVDHEGRAGSVVKHYDLRGSTIVAPDPIALERELERRGRLREIGGGV